MTDNADPREAELAKLDSHLEILQGQAVLLMMEKAGIPKMRDELLAQFEELLNNANDEDEKPLPQPPATPMNVFVRNTTNSSRDAPIYGSSFTPSPNRPLVVRKQATYSLWTSVCSTAWHPQENGKA